MDSGAWRAPRGCLRRRWVWVAGAFDGPREAIRDDVEAEQLGPRPPHDLEPEVVDRVLPQLFPADGFRRRRGIARSVLAHAVELADDPEFLPEEVDPRDERAVGSEQLALQVRLGDPGRPEPEPAERFAGALAAPVEKCDDAARRRDTAALGGGVERARDPMSADGWIRSSESPAITASSTVSDRARSTIVRAGAVTAAAPATKISSRASGAVWTWRWSVRRPPDLRSRVT